MASLLGGSAPGAGAPIPLSDYCDGSDAGDDTACLLEWFEAGRTSGDNRLRATPGTYLYGSPMPLHSGLRLECTGSSQVTFRRNGGSGLFLRAAAPVENVLVQDCGFDVNGGTAEFLTVIGVNPEPTGPSRNLRVRRNLFFDGTLSGMSAQQRQYILLLNCHDCRVEQNRLLNGGRIKLGRPGTDLSIVRNYVRDANDNAITVVDLSNGASRHIVIEDNHIVSPLAIGIFFGADGESQTGVTTESVRIENNVIEGDWTTACILGTLPATAVDVRVLRNRCTKTGIAGAFRVGIGIKRTSDATLPARRIRLERNEITSTAVASDPPTSPLDLGGIFISGRHSDLRVMRNRITDIGARSILLRAVHIAEGRITHNVFDGALVIEGTVSGSTSPNTVVPD